MFADAIREIRFNPGRIIATVMAIAISVAFMAGVSVFMTTSSQSLANTMSMPLSKADVVITSGDAEKVAALAATSPGVTATQTIKMLHFPVTSPSGTQWVELTNRPAEGFAWTSLIQGRWPTGDEVALSRGGAAALKLNVGDVLHMPSGVVTLVGITDAPNAPFGYQGFASDTVMAQASGGQVLVQVASGTSASDLAAHLAAELKSADEHVRVTTAEAARAETVKELYAGFSAAKFALWGFAAISVLVGMIIIANTFAILLAQRRRQIGLLRAIGASGAQVRRKFLAESVVIGVVGSAFGLALGASIAAFGLWWTGQLYWGLTLPLVDLGVAFTVGVLATLVAAITPSLRATRISPMEALQVAPSAAHSKRITVLRYVLCGVFALVGTGLSLAAFFVKNNNIVYGMGAGAALSVAVLGAAPIYVPWMLRGLGRLLGFFGATFRLAATNGARNPQRAAATATALMLAVGLVVTLQVGVATMRSSALSGLEARYPINLAISTYEKPIPADVIDKLSALKGVSLTRPIPGVTLGHSVIISKAIAPGNAMAELAPNATVPNVDDGIVLVPRGIRDIADGMEITVPGPKATLRLTAKTSHFSSNGAVIISQANLAKLGTPQITTVWLKLDDTSQVAATIQALQSLQLGTEYDINGSAVESAMIGKVIDTLLITMTSLLGVAVLVALVGVANTLGLSVIERKRESALLRALGMQRSSLRMMLLIEALLLALVASVVGIAAGAYFGWLGTSTAFKMMPSTADQELVYSVDIWWTLGLLVVIFGAAALASVLPGRKASRATPTEVLATE